MKKSICSAMTALLLAGAVVSGCSNSDDEGSGGGESVEISFVAALVNDSYFVTVRCGAEAAAKRLNAELEWTGPASADVAEEIQALSSVATTNPDGVALAPFSNTGFGGVVRQLMSRGIPVAMSGQTLDPPDGLVTFITDFREGGTSLADEIGDITGGSGTMAIVATSTGNKTDSDRYTGLIPILADRFPDLEVRDPEYANNSTAKAASITSSIIQGNPDLKLVYATSGPQAAGAASAITAAKATHRVKLISFDSNQQQIRLLERGQLAATVAQSPYLSGDKTVAALVDYLRSSKGESGGQVQSSDRVEFTPTKVLTPENVDSPAAKRYQYLERCESGATQGGEG